jgi:hypothetical protein
MFAHFNGRSWSYLVDQIPWSQFVIGCDDSFSGPQTIFKITDLDTVDDNFGFGMSPPNRDSSKVKLFVVLDDPKTKWGVGTGFTTELQPRRQGMLRHISFVFKTKVMVVQKMLVVRLERIAAYNPTKGQEMRIKCSSEQERP